jgi:DNA-binding beta-propeller fold protein YncE
VLAAALAVLSAGALAACGSEDDPREFPPAAEPARSPVPAERPAGRVIEIGNKPEGIAIDAETGIAAVALTDPDELALVDVDTLKVRRRVPLPGAPRHLRLAGPGGPVLVPAESGDAIVEVSLPSGRTRVTRVGDGPHDADNVGERLFVGDEFGSTLTLVEDGRRVKQVPTPLQPGGVAAFRDPAGRVAIVGVRERAVALYDTEGRELARERAGVGPTHVEAGDEGRLYVADTDGNAVLLFRTRPGLGLVRRIAVPGQPYATTLDRQRGKLWVTLTETNRAVQLTAEVQVRKQREFPTVRQPNSIAVHEPSGRVFVASRTDGTLQVHDAY